VFYRLADDRVKAMVTLLYGLFCQPDAGGEPPRDRP